MFSVLKNLALSCTVVIALQTQWQGHTLETHLVSWMNSSVVGLEIRKFVATAMQTLNIAVESGSRTIAESREELMKDEPGHRNLGFGRSQAFLQEQVDKLGEAALQRAEMNEQLKELTASE